MSKQAQKAEPSDVELTLPIAEPRDGVYVSNHVEVQLTGRQALAMRRLLDGLHEAHATFDGGKYVNTVPDVVRYILSVVADLAGLPG